MINARLLLMVVICLTMVAHTPARADQEEQFELRPAQVAQRAFQAWIRGDGQGFAAHCHTVTREEAEHLAALASAMDAFGAIRAAVAERLGPEAAAELMPSDESAVPSQQELASAPEILRGDRATVIIRPDTPEMNTPMVRIDGRWKVSVYDMYHFGINSARDKERALAQWNRIASRQRQIADDVASGRYATVHRVQAAVMESLADD